jgi:hypothetical protein
MGHKVRPQAQAAGRCFEKGGGENRQKTGWDSRVRKAEFKSPGHLLAGELPDRAGFPVGLAEKPGPGGAVFSDCHGNGILVDIQADARYYTYDLPPWVLKKIVALNRS